MDRSKRNDRNDRNDRNAREGFGDDQGTRVGAPDQEQASPAPHSNEPARPEQTTGVGKEMHPDKSKPPVLQSEQHRSGSGGKGGEPVTSSHDRKPSR
jgi:hypothetical protein